MKVGFVSIWDEYNKNVFLDDYNYYLGHDLFQHFRYLKEQAVLQEIEFKYAGDFPIDKIDAFLFHLTPHEENPFYRYARAHRIPMFLYLDEPESVYPQGHSLALHVDFLKIFTPYDLFIDDKRYIKIQLNPYPPQINMLRQIKDKFCTLINSNKLFPHAQELYSKRVEIVRWFEMNRPGMFDLYGHGWPAQYFSSYRGAVADKRDVLSKYKFSICFENFRDTPGYITEKIFDSFFAGCVPVYWGASNIEKYIPPGCFIDFRKFNSYESLVNYMEYMPDDEYIGYLNCIENFIQTDMQKHFSLTEYTNTMINNIASALHHQTAQNPVALGPNIPEELQELVDPDLHGPGIRSLGWWIIYARQTLQQGNADKTARIVELLSTLIDQRRFGLNSMMSEEEYRIHIDMLAISALSSLNRHGEALDVCKRVRRYATKHPDTRYYEASIQVSKAISALNEAHKLLDNFDLLVATNSELLPRDLTLSDWQVPLLKANVQFSLGNLVQSYQNYVMALQGCPTYFSARQTIQNNLGIFVESCKQIAGSQNV